MCESHETDRMIISPSQAEEIVSKAGRIHVRDCPCRAQEQLCPRDTWEVCLLFEHASPEDLQGARRITPGEALSILRTTSERQAIYNLFSTRDGKRVTELCSCCTCCCHPLNQMREQGRYGEQIRSEYVAVTDTARCVGCGACEAICFFEARRVVNGGLHLADERCFGCGKCIDSCPEDAISLVQQVGRGVVIPSC